MDNTNYPWLVVEKGRPEDSFSSQRDQIHRWQQGHTVHSVITGLQFGNLPFIPTATNGNCSLKKKYFCNNKTVSLSELEQAFIDCSDEEDVFKFGLLYFVVFVLLGSEKHVNIGMRYLKLAEDVEDFQKYPWGAVSYAKTNSSLLRALCTEYQRVKVP